MRGHACRQGVEGADCEGLGEKQENGGVKSLLGRLRGKLNIHTVKPQGDSGRSPLELLSGIMGTGPLSHHTAMPPTWGATVVSALHAVWALAAVAHSRKQLVDLGAHRYILIMLSSVVHTNEKRLEGKTTAQVKCVWRVRNAALGM
jgi:hypothetical protein